MRRTLGGVLACLLSAGCFGPVCEDRVGECVVPESPDARAALPDTGLADAQVPVDAGGLPDAGPSADSGAADAGAAPDAARPPNDDVTWFVTPEEYRGNEIRGLAGADAKCAEAGKRLGLSVIRALLSDSRTNARDRLPALPGEVRNVKGQVLVSRLEFLFPLPPFGELGLQANLDPQGVVRDGYNRGEGFWWASDLYGVRNSSPLFSFCSDWSADPDALDSAIQIDLRHREGSLGPSGAGCTVGNPGRLICVGW